MASKIVILGRDVFEIQKIAINIKLLVVTKI